jgi:hypothetical protein
MELYKTLAGLDLDWFLIDKNSNIAAFSSGGGLMPKFVEANIGIHLEFTKYLQTLNSITDTLVLNPKIESYVDLNSVIALKGKSKIDTYSSFFCKLSLKGLFAFDKTDLENLDDDCYHLVTSPSRVFKAQDLPTNFQEFIPQINSLDFEKIDFIKINTIIF